MQLGIDFGTTRTIVAVADRGNYPVVSFENNQGDSQEWIPSLIAIRGNERRYGFDAAAVTDDPEWTFYRSFKRFLSSASPNGTIFGIPVFLLLREFFINLRSALPMNIKGHYPAFKVWAGAQADIDRIVTIWRECLAASKGPYLFGATPCLADAMYAPVCTRFLTYNVKLDPVCAAYCRSIIAMPYMGEWIEAARNEPDDVTELDVEF